MSKAILMGSLEIAGAIGMGVGAFLDPALIANPLYLKVMFGLGVAGVGQLVATGIEDLVNPNQGPGITTQQAAQYRPICYGMRQVAGTMIYQSTTGGKHDQDNNIVVVAAHPIEGFVSLYLDGRKVGWKSGSAENKTFANGVNFGGDADGTTRTGPTGTNYNFGTLVFADAYDGTQSTSTYSTAMEANDPTWAPSANGTPSVSGCAYAYLKIEYDSSQFPQRPQLRWVIQGRNDIYDPRTNTRGYSENWALIVADVLLNNDYGVGVSQSQINTAQWIAAANVCDEMVACAGGEEARYTCHFTGDTQAASGDILSQMMPTAAGRISYVNGQFYIYPAYWQGETGFTFSEDDLVGTPNWLPYRKLPALFNRVSGTYVAPWFPYSVAGNLYDSNGFYDGTTADLTSLAWQPTSFPYYAEDVLHGYASDQWLAQDGGHIYYKNLPLSCCNSLSQAQRVAKITLLRNRWQGTGTLQFSLSAYKAMPADVISMNFGLFGWTEKTLEVTGFRTVPQVDTYGEKPPQITVEVDVAETDASVYEWNATDELTVNTTPALGGSVPYTVAPPTSVVLDSSAATAVVGADGVVTPRVKVTWDSPADAYVTQIGIEYATAGSGNWIDAGPLVDVSVYQAFIPGVVAGQSYDFRIRSLRSNGAASVWVEIDSYTVSATYSSITTEGLSPNIGYNQNNNASIDSVSESGAASIRVYGPGGVGSSWDFLNGSLTITEPAADITGLAYATVYFVVLDSSTGDYHAFTDYNDTLPDSYISLGSLTTIGSGGTGGTIGGGGGSVGGGGGGGPRSPYNPPLENTN